jgi:histidinol-phosphatase (PHP family)
MTLPPDSHVHTEWSWDAVEGSMERTCARAVAMGLPAVAFTEHVDHTRWTVLFTDDDADSDHLRRLVSADGVLTPPPLDVGGYLDCVQRCRDRFPELRIVSGVELGDPHWHAAPVAAVLDAGRFELVLGSLHCLRVDDAFFEPPVLFRRLTTADVMRGYLAEAAELIERCGSFSVLAHIDYPVRYWPRNASPFDPAEFEDEFRHALRLLAESGRALEVSTRVPLHPEIVRWWREEGGAQVTFGSDAHDPLGLAAGFGVAATMVEAHGFRAGRHPYDVWTRGS